MAEKSSRKAVAKPAAKTLKEKRLDKKAKSSGGISHEDVVSARVKKK
ncbi:hypothetical protein HQQ81_09835 [Microbacteriaceae bacterium VKM Ac-2854]|nr:hypothetical protein [Microbacteriaceae bacterium VKM Ac-2854]